MTSVPHGMSRYDRLVRECLDNRALNDRRPLPQVFGYLLDENPVTGNLSRQTIVDAFDAMVESMRTGTVEDGPAEAGMTFFGQFIDHDVTLDATSAIGTRIDPRSIRNVRTPNLDLDCVYGDGPEASPFLYSRDHEGFMLFGRDDSPNDLPRNRDGRALIGDPRNDENVVVSQIHGAFITLHNILMTRAEANDSAHADVKACGEMGVRSDVWREVLPPKLKDFETVRRFIRLHYQWLILNEFLPAFVDPASIHAALAHDPFHDRGPIMPAEFSVAAYRFGHATVQPRYRMRHGEDPVDLFRMVGFSRRGPETDIHMSQFFGAAAQRALPVGLRMAETLFALPDNVVAAPLQWGEVEIPVERAKKLGLRNILRDRTAMLLPSGQQVARTLGLPELRAPRPLLDHGVTKTPLWVYCLQEAEEMGQGRLTGVGGAIVASVFVRLLKLDPESVLNTPGFTPWSGFGSHCSMAGLMAFVEAHRDEVAHRADLRNG